MDYFLTREEGPVRGDARTALHLILEKLKSDLNELNWKDESINPAPKLLRLYVCAFEKETGTYLRTLAMKGNGVWICSLTGKSLGLSTGEIPMEVTHWMYEPEPPRSNNDV